MRLRVKKGQRAAPRLLMRAVELKKNLPIRFLIGCL